MVKLALIIVLFVGYPFITPVWASDNTDPAANESNHKNSVTSFSFGGSPLPTPYIPPPMAQPTVPDLQPLPDTSYEPPPEKSNMDCLNRVDGVYYP